MRASYAFSWARLRLGHSLSGSCPFARRGLRVVVLQLPRALRRRMFLQHTAAGSRGHSETTLFWKLLQQMQDLRRRTGDEDFVAGPKELFEPGPKITDDRNSACSGFEQPNARRVSRRDHVASRDVQREPLGRVKGRMLRGWQVVNAFDVFRPVDTDRVLRTGDHKASLRRAAGRLEQEFLHRGLPVVAVGAEIAKFPAY